MNGVRATIIAWPVLKFYIKLGHEGSYENIKQLLQDENNSSKMQTRYIPMRKYY